MLNGEGKLLEAQRLNSTKYDLEMLGQWLLQRGENYARHLAGREEGTPPSA